MKSLGMDENLKDRLLDLLEQDDFINENRFQQAFVRGKAKIKGWGPEKIRQKLFQELGREPEFKIETGHENHKEAENKLRKALLKKSDELRQKKDPQWKAKLLRFGLSRGFDWETVSSLINKLE